MVLNQENRQVEFIAQAANKVCQLVRFLGVHARRRFVQQQQARPRGQRTHNFQVPLLAIRQAACLFIPHVPQVDLLQQRFHLGFRRRLLLAVRGRAQRRCEVTGLDVEVLRNQHVLVHRQILEQANVLERARHAHLGDIARLFARDVHFLPVRVRVIHVTVGRRVHARHHVEGRRLARAVRANQRHNIMLGNFQRQLVDGNDAAKLHGNVVRS